jgi:hypothetical protein
LDCEPAIEFVKVVIVQFLSFGINKVICAFDVVNDVSVLLVGQPRIDRAFQRILEIRRVHRSTIRATQVVADVKGHARAVSRDLVLVRRAGSDVARSV